MEFGPIYNFLSTKIWPIFFEYGKFFAYLTLILTIISIILSILVIKERFINSNKSKRRKDNKSYFMILSLLLIISSFVYWSVASERVFFSYDETDLKFYIASIRLAQEGEFRPPGTPMGGFSYILIFLFRIFPSLTDPFNLFNFIIWMNYFVLLFMIFLIFDMFYLKSKNKLIPIFLTLTILFYTPLIESIWYYKLYYMICLAGLFFTYYVFIKMNDLQKNNKLTKLGKFYYPLLILILLFLTSHSRPELLILSFPILLYSIPFLIKEFKSCRWQGRLYYIILISFFILIHIDVLSWYILSNSQRLNDGTLQFNRPVISRDIMNVFEWLSYSFIFILLFSKRTAIFGLLYIPFFTYIRFSLMWEWILYPTYFVFALFLILYNFPIFHNKKTASLVISICLFLSMFALSPFYPFERNLFYYPLQYSEKDDDGSQILYLKEYLKDKEYIIYESWPDIFSTYIFSDSPSEFKEFRKELSSNMSIFFRDGYHLNLSSSFFLEQEKPVLFAYNRDITDYTLYLNDSNVTFSKLIDKPFAYNLYELHFHFYDENITK